MKTAIYTLLTCIAVTTAALVVYAACKPTSIERLPLNFKVNGRTVVKEFYPLMSLRHLLRRLFSTRSIGHRRSEILMSLLMANVPGAVTLMMTG
jgi:hypothetical protein